MRVLLTGVCGFVGATFAHGLREEWPDLELRKISLAVRQGDIRCPSVGLAKRHPDGVSAEVTNH